jgi:hypothetical protein
MYATNRITLHKLPGNFLYILSKGIQVYPCGITLMDIGEHPFGDPWELPASAANAVIFPTSTALVVRLDHQGGISNNI